MIPFDPKIPWRLELGAQLTGKNRVRFKVWAPRVSSVDVKILEGPVLPMEKAAGGFFTAETSLAAGRRYFYVLDKKAERPDPVSRYQPAGVHGPSEIVDPSRFHWSDGKWKGLPLEKYVFYEMHAGTFTREGTFAAAAEKIPYLKKTGVTCVEIMPVAQFPGKRNWGYDGTGLYAPQNSYGGPEGLKHFVNACHRAGLAVCLDVVYNHLGPEGNYLREFGPYFTNRYQTPWGEALNYDGRDSGPVRRHILDNALYWASEYHADALRLDAVHGIFDFSAKHILAELAEEIAALSSALGRKVHLIAESDLNDPRLVRPRQRGGFALDAQWSDDFHHALHVSLTGEKTGYYEDFNGLPDLAEAMKKTFVYAGRYSPHRGRAHGASAAGLSGKQFVIAAQNHDQIGNRAEGDRLSATLSAGLQKVSAVMLLLSPYLPLLFMGEEYGERAPFQYFIDHEDAGLVEAVRKGRLEEFKAFGWEHIPDPKSPAAFSASKLTWPDLKRTPHGKMWLLYRDLLRLRKKMKILSELDRGHLSVRCGETWLAWEYASTGKRFGVVCSLARNESGLVAPFGGRAVFEELLNTEDKRYGGVLPSKRRVYHRMLPLAPESAVAGILTPA